MASFLLLLDSHEPHKRGWWANTVEAEKEWQIQCSFFLCYSKGFRFKCSNPPPERHLAGQGPTKGLILFCTMAWEKILACENLLNRKYMIVGWCCMCQSSVGRQVDHLQIHCTATFNLWSFFCRSFEVLRVLPKKSSIICLDGEFGWINIVPLCFDVDYTKGTQSRHFRRWRNYKVSVISNLHQFCIRVFSHLRFYK